MMKLFFFLFLFSYSITGFSQFGTYQSYAVNEQSVVLQTNNGQIVLKAFPGNAMQVKFVRNHAENKQLSNAVIVAPLSDVLQVQEQAEVVTVYRNQQAVVQYDKNKETIQVFNPGNDLYFTSFSDEDIIGFRYTLTEEEQIYGAGERALPLNRRGYKFTLYNKPNYSYGMGETDLNYSLPIISSNRNYLLFFDNPQKGYFDIGKTNSTLFEYGVIGGDLNFYFIKGESQIDLSKKLTELTGSQPIPPRWAFGHLQSRFGYRSQQETEQIVEQTLAANIPLDAVIIDLFWFGNGKPGDWQMGDLAWQKERFPEPESLISELKDKGVKTILITEPYITDQSFNYEEAIEEGILAQDSTGKDYKLKHFYFGKGGLIDIFKPKAQDWIWQKYNQQIEKGIAGWWVDLAEPEHHPSDVIHAVGSADQVHNIFGHYWDKMLFDKYRQHYPNQRLFNLNRSGYAGSGRYGVFPWTGDVGRNWSGLQAQLPLLITMSLHGLPYIHSDAGGFAGGEKDAELYTRWMQFAALTPIFRPHGAVASEESGDAIIEPELIFWDEQTQNIVKKWIEYRYQLIPYFYQLAYKQWLYGTPIMLPVMENNTMVNNEYLLGENILVAPILQANVDERKLYLPEGHWIEKATNKIYAGEQWISVQTNINNIPVFYKAGSILPMKSNFLNTDHYPEKFIFHVFPDEQPIVLNLFNDDGKTPYSIGKEEFEIIQVLYDNIRGRQQIQLSSKGSFTGKTKSRPIQFVLHSQFEEPRRVEVNGKQLPFTYNKEKQIIQFEISNWDNEYGNIVIM